MLQFLDQLMHDKAKVSLSLVSLQGPYPVSLQPWLAGQRNAKFLMLRACMTVFQVCSSLVIRAVVNLQGLRHCMENCFPRFLWPQALPFGFLPTSPEQPLIFCFFGPVVKVPIVNHLEFLRDEELEERREKRRKQLAEEETKITDKGKEDKENRDQSAQVIPMSWEDSSLAMSALTSLQFQHTYGWPQESLKILRRSHWTWEIIHSKFTVHTYGF